MRITRRMLLATTGLGLCRPLFADPPRVTKPTKRSEDQSETEVNLILLTDATAAAEHAQAWGQRLQKFEIGFQTRQAIAGEKLQVTEKKSGRLRQVAVVAQLDRNGKIVCQNRAFTLGDADKLADWIRELKAYGAQGAPNGKPMFGLDERQFNTVLKALSTPVEVETNGLTLDGVLKKLPIPREYPIRLTPAAERTIQELGRDKVVRQRLAGLSFGSVLAAALGEFGLSFRPLRTPSAKIELAISPRSDDTDAWPVGWPLDPSKPQGQLVPALFQMVPVELNEAPLPDVLVAAAEASETPIVIDHFAIELQGIDLSEIKITIPNRKTTWGVLLRQITTPHKLGRRILTDDAGRPFVLITTLKVALKESPAAKKSDND